MMREPCVCPAIGHWERCVLRLQCCALHSWLGYQAASVTTATASVDVSGDPYTAADTQGPLCINAADIDSNTYGALTPGVTITPVCIDFKQVLSINCEYQFDSCSVCFKSREIDVCRSSATLRIRCGPSQCLLELARCVGLGSSIRSSAR